MHCITLRCVTVTLTVAATVTVAGSELHYMCISQIRTSFQNAGLVDGSPYPWFHFIFAPVSNIFCWFPSSSGTWNFYVQSGVSSFWCRPLVTLVLKRRRHTLGRKVAGLFGTLGRCDSLSSRFCWTWFSTDSDVQSHTIFWKAQMKTNKHMPSTLHRWTSPCVEGWKT